MEPYYQAAEPRLSFSLSLPLSLFLALRESQERGSRSRGHRPVVGAGVLCASAHLPRKG